MSASVVGQDAAWAAWTGLLPPVAGRLLRDAVGGRHPQVSVAVQGPGGTGKTILLTQLATAYRNAGVAVANEYTAPAPGELTDRVAVIVDDAQRLTEERAGRLRELVGHPLARVTVAYRPWPRPPALVELVEKMGNERELVVLGHVDRDVVQRWATAELGPAVPADLVDFVMHQTGGLPGLVNHMIRSLAEDAAAGGRGTPAPDASPGPSPSFRVPADVVNRVRAGLAALDDENRAVLHALAAGSPLDLDVLSDVLEVPARRADELVTRARASGFLLDDGIVVPLVQSVLLDSTPTDVTRYTRRRLLALLVDRGDEPIELARALAADHVREPRAARLLEQHGSAALAVDPALAGVLLGEAAATGAPAGTLAARRAQAAALTGDYDGALQWADPALNDESAPDRERATGVVAAILAQRGLLARSAELYRLAGPERRGSVALALLATGARAEALEVLSAEAPAAATGMPTMLAGSESLMAQGVLQSLRSGSSAADDIAAALSILTRAAALVEPMGRTALLLDTPAALAALVALHSGELTVAESVLRRAVQAEVGGPPARARHHLLLAWTAMLRGRLGTARQHMARAHEGSADSLEPRDELFLRALAVGLARRTGDLPALTTAWEHAREAMLRYPVDLFALLPLGELVVAGARMKDGDRLAPHLAEAQALLARLGDPQLWAAPLHWCGAQAAILADNPAALEPHATALVAAARTSRYAATVAQAGRSWLRVLTNQVQAQAAITAAEDLASIGLTWDGSRLAGQAAARAVDARDRTALLLCARSLNEPDDPGPEARQVTGADDDGHPAAPPAGSTGLLSHREQEVAALVVVGQTYREIGATLFISAKTVEHHVSRMRHRLGASSRSDLITRLRAELAAAG
ncbi:regulatory protein, luxR family [Modestobacter sp. DSM 44400]|uniref:LuxR C-terminal-related transcriptional regulator n=1 Tax=Modestobacter sp. DSM 44400 TaxID=1550230 RepID=UPI000898DBE2|nr:LuxR C-terminal-related transcriptional regulator [Modestobacter sp. DSM 44400]SDY18084.1 regulatory protein, luxR family [Modestobacter sp. DSM 44400]